MPNNKRYHTIMADPPWQADQTRDRGAINYYNLMSVDQIKALPVADLAEPDAHFWLWVTQASLRDGYDVLESWGFTPRSVLTWIKPRMGMGHFLRNAAEQVLFGTRGNAPILFKSQPNWVFAPLQDHSHKPEEQYAIIERCSPGPYLELFARRRQPGWDVWGDQIESDITIPGYPVPRVKGQEAL